MIQKEGYMENSLSSSIVHAQSSYSQDTKISEMSEVYFKLRWSVSLGHCSCWLIGTDSFVLLFYVPL